MRTRGKFRQGAVGLALASALLVGTAGLASADYASDYQKALDLGTQAYVYGVPLLDMARTFQTQTSVNVPDGRGDAPVNQFSHIRHLADPLDRTVVAPNHDTLYSIAWLDLTPQPIVIHVPFQPDRFHVVPLLSPYQENFANIGSPAAALPDGDYLITPPGWRGRLPDGLRQIESPYDRVWIVVRTLVGGPEDEVNVEAIQDQYSLTPLNKWGKNKPYTPKPPKYEDTTVDTATIPGTQPGEDPLDFFDALGSELARFLPPAADLPLLKQLVQVGVGPFLQPGEWPLSKFLSQGTKDGLRAAVAAGKAKVNQDLLALFQAGFAAHNGWLVSATGIYGTNYTLRAIVDLIGLGAPTSDMAIYPFAQTDRLGARLTGANRYVAHLPPSLLPPPVDGFWSLTMYDANQFFVPNPIDRYLLNDRSDLHYNADGSLDFYIQTDAPADPEQEKNWLPAPTGPFNLLFRLWGPKPEAIPGILDGTGWKAPTILPCLPTGFTATGWACAS
jgi:hypothetical protein